MSRVRDELDEHQSATLKYRAVPCKCGRCEDWHISDVADIQGVKFTRQQAEVIADVLNQLENRSQGIWTIIVEIPLRG